MSFKTDLRCVVPSRRMKNAGFTLAEMAIVILIMGIALSMGLKMVTANLDNSAFSETKSKQERIKIALIGFLRTNGRLPCPDRDLIATNTGQEPAPPLLCTGLTEGYGIVPWAALGVSRDTVIDGWGNYFTYAVANASVAAPAAPNPPSRHVNNNQNWTTRVGFDIRSLVPTTAAVTGFQTLLIQNRDALPGPTTESFTAVVVLLSHGKNGFGAKTTKVSARNPGALLDEAANATVGTTTFIRRPMTDNVAAAGGVYDDVLAYMTPQDLLQPLISEKTMKVCKSYCTSTSTCPSTPLPTSCTASNVPIGNSAPACPCTAGESLPP
jgi:prepilin-type N-terminal cleavage/methylation domain-containing protein